jgi:hypothetical protein
MRVFKNKIIRDLVLVFFAVAALATAAPVTYIFGANVSADLDGNAVSGPLTVVAAADTTNVTFNGNVWRVIPTSVIINLNGQALVLDASQSYVFDNLAANKVGFGINGIPSCCDVIQHVRAEYGVYDLQSSIGPLAADANLSIADFADVPTSGGLLSIRSMDDNTFQAIIGDVPEPGSIALMASAAGALALLRRRLWRA